MFWTVTLSILQGCSQAVKLFFLTLLFALPLGLMVAFGSMSKWAPFRALAYRQQEARGFARWLSQLRPLSALTNVIVWVIRGTPLILQLIIIFYGPGTWFGTNPWNRGLGMRRHVRQQAQAGKQGRHALPSPVQRPQFSQTIRKRHHYYGTIKYKIIKIGI